SILQFIAAIMNRVCNQMLGLTLTLDANFCPRDLSACDQYEIQMVLISWVTRWSVRALTHRLMNLSCLSGAQDLYLSPGCLKSFSFSMTRLSRLPDKTTEGIGCLSAARTVENLEGK
ncbi:hypothetical protein RAG64_27520, partial [Klebsiella pneumoniae]